MKTFIAAVILMIYSATAGAFSKDVIYPRVSGVWTDGGKMIYIQPVMESGKADQIIICIGEAKIETDVYSIDWVQRKITVKVPMVNGGHQLWTFGYDYDDKSYIQFTSPLFGDGYLRFVRNLTRMDIDFIRGLEPL